MYIVFEGIDGAGKTTLMKKVAEWLRELVKDSDIKVHERREPTKGFEESLPLRDPLIFIDDDAMLALSYAADRLVIHDDISWFLRNGRIVLSDRSYISSLVYQKDTDFVREINKYALKPDLIVFLDVPPEIARKRIIQRDGIEKAPSIEKLEQLRKKYSGIFGLDGGYPDKGVFGLDYFEVDATKSPDEMLEEIKQVLKGIGNDWLNGLWQPRHLREKE